MRPLDRIDRRLVALLQNDARLSNKELAAAVGLSPSSCLERVRRLYSDGILTGAHAAAAPATLGIGLQALVAVRLARHSRDQVESFREHALSVPEVVASYHVTGGNDFLLHVAVRDTEHLREVALSAFTTRPEVAHIQTHLVFEYVRKPGWPETGR